MKKDYDYKVESQESLSKRYSNSSIDEENSRAANEEDELNIFCACASQMLNIGCNL